MTKKRLLPADRKAEILAAAIKVASRPGGWGKLTREAVAKEANCAAGLPSKYFGTMATFRRSIMRAAIAQGNLDILAQGIAAGERSALKAPVELKIKALEALAG